MGFEEEVRRIVEQCKSKEDGRQTAMFSATWPAAIQKIAMDYMVDPVRVYVGFESLVGSNDGTGMVDDSLSANKRVTQNVEVIEDRQRESRLRQILQKVHSKRNNRVLVFALYKKEAERLEQSLRRDGWNCCSIHGNKTQQARTEALSQFKDGSCPLLIATDVAARGKWNNPNVDARSVYACHLTFFVGSFQVLIFPVWRLSSTLRSRSRSRTMSIALAGQDALDKQASVTPFSSRVTSHTPESCNR